MKSWLKMMLLLMCAVSQAGEINVLAIEQRWQSNQLYITPKFDIKSSDEIDEAIDNGIVLTLIIKVHFSKARTFWFDENKHQIHHLYQIRYFSLSGQYQLHNTTTDERHSFVLLNDLWNHLANDLRFVTDIPSISTADLISVRLRLDSGALPSALQIPVLLSTEWTFKSDWFQAPLEPKP